MLDVDVDTHGPIFDGRAERAASAYCDAAEHAIADHGVNVVRAGTRVFQNPTGYYESHIQTDRSRGDSVVTDGGVVYGPHLESGSRDSSFRGYGLWRLGAQRLQAQAVPVAERVLPPYVARMGD